MLKEGKKEEIYVDLGVRKMGDIKLRVIRI